MEYSRLSQEIKEATAELKKKWKNIFLIEAEDKHFIFRPLTRIEYINLTETYPTTDDLVEDLVFEMCVLYKEVDSIECLLPGTVIGLAESIIAVSGFSTPEVFIGLLEDNRNKMELADSQMLVLLIKAFPNLSIEDINNLDIQQLTYYLALAEQILDVKINLEQQDQTDKDKKPKLLVDFEAENKEFMNGVPINPRGNHT